MSPPTYYYILLGFLSVSPKNAFPEKAAAGNLVDTETGKEYLKGMDTGPSVRSVLSFVCSSVGHFSMLTDATGTTST